MTTPTKLSDIVDNMGEAEGLDAYLHLPSGKVFQYFDDYSPYTEFSEKDLERLSAQEQAAARIALSFDEESDQFLSLPSKYDVHEYQIMKDFCHHQINERVEKELLNSIRGSGAFRRFRDKLDRFNLTQNWYTFREKAFYEIAIEWCIDRKIEYIDDRPTPKRSKKSTSMEQIVKDWQKNAKKKDKQNFNFLTSLKMKTQERVDSVAKEKHEEAFEKIDCLACGNCCKKLQPELNEEDIDRVAPHLNLSKKAFIEKYLEKDEDGDLLMNHAPCSFLGADNKCSIYEIRPATCRSYPHTQKDNFASRRYFHSSNLLVCPAAYYVVEQMKKHF